MPLRFYWNAGKPHALGIENTVATFDVFCQMQLCRVG